MDGSLLFTAVDYLFLWAAHVIISLLFTGGRSFRRIAFPCSSILIIVLVLVGVGSIIQSDAANATIGCIIAILHALTLTRKSF